jgi:hypothetical protein
MIVLTSPRTLKIVSDLQPSKDGEISGNAVDKLNLILLAGEAAIRRLSEVDLFIDGYLDGAPDASPAAKLANQIQQIIHPQL